MTDHVTWIDGTAHSRAAVARGPGLPPPVFAMGSEGTLAIADEDITIVPDFGIQILDPIIDQGPGVIAFTVSSGIPETGIDFYIDGALAWSTTLDSAGALDQSSLGIYIGAGADQGVHTLEGRQVNPADSSVITADATYEVLFPPNPYPSLAPLDADPVAIPEAVVNGVRKWVLQDLFPTGSGGLGSYVFEVNPSEMTSPHWQNTFNSRHTTAKSGQFHVFQAGRTITEWTFSGYAPTEDMINQLQAYRNLNRRFYLIDHRNRAWKVVFTNINLKARLRHNYNGVITDWGHDYEITALVLDQEWWEPV